MYTEEQIVEAETLYRRTDLTVQDIATYLRVNEFEAANDSTMKSSLVKKPRLAVYRNPKS